MPSAASVVDRRLRARLDRIGDGDERRSTLPRLGDEHRGPALAGVISLRAPRMRRAPARDSSSISARLPSATGVPRRSPVTPLPVTERKPVIVERLGAARRRALVMARASGCAEPRSSAAATASTQPSSTPLSGITSPSTGWPSVSVPVLSTISVSTPAKRLERLGVPDQHARHARRARSPPSPTSASPARAHRGRR